MIGIQNLRLAGQFHWLIMPKLHLVRDIEGLDGEHLPLCEFKKNIPTLWPFCN